MTPVFAPVAGSPFKASFANPGFGFSISPSGRLLALGGPTNVPYTHTGDVAVFSISSRGALAQIPGSPFPTDDFPQSIAFSPSGRLLATASEYDATTTGGGEVSVFSVGPDGTLTQAPGSPYAAPASAYSLAFSPSGAFLVSSNENVNLGQTDTATMFSVGPDGELTPISGSPFSTGIASEPVTFSPSGSLLVAAGTGMNSYNGAISVFSVASGGVLSPVAGSPFAGGRNSAPSVVAFTPSGRLLAAADTQPTDQDYSVSMYTVASNGALSTVPGSPFKAGFEPNSLSFSPSGRLLAVGNTNGGTSVFSVSRTGRLHQVPGSPFNTRSRITDVAFTPSGRFLITYGSNARKFWVYAVKVERLRRDRTHRRSRH